MKPLDRYLQRARIARIRPFVRPGDVVLDVGCSDGTMLRALAGTIAHGVGVDPELPAPVSGPGYELHPGHFPDAVPAGVRCDLIAMLAVIEHMPPDVQARLADACAAILKPGGRIAITVPSPRVDGILHILGALRLVDGMSVHEHYGFRVEEMPAIFPAPAYRLVVRRRFQLGLNNLFVFELADKG
jgi:SAM-dependent methyltransferase